MKLLLRNIETKFKTESLIKSMTRSSNYKELLMSFKIDKEKNKESLTM